MIKKVAGLEQGNILQMKSASCLQEYNVKKEDCEFTSLMKMSMM